MFHRQNEKVLTELLSTAPISTAAKNLQRKEDLKEFRILQKLERAARSDVYMKNETISIYLHVHAIIHMTRLVVFPWVSTAILSCPPPCLPYQYKPLNPKPYNCCCGQETCPE